MREKNENGNEIGYTIIDTNRANLKKELVDCVTFDENPPVDCDFQKTSLILQVLQLREKNAVNIETEYMITGSNRTFLIDQVSLELCKGGSDE